MRLGTRQDAGPYRHSRIWAVSDVIDDNAWRPPRAASRTARGDRGVRRPGRDRPRRRLGRLPGPRPGGRARRRDQGALGRRPGRAPSGSCARSRSPSSSAASTPTSSPSWPSAPPPRGGRRSSWTTSSAAASTTSSATAARWPSTRRSPWAWWWPTPSRSRTRTACCTATSSRRTCWCSRPRGCWPTSGSRGSSTPSTPRRWRGSPTGTPRPSCSTGSRRPPPTTSGPWGRPCSPCSTGGRRSPATTPTTTRRWPTCGGSAPRSTASSPTTKGRATPRR